MPKLDPAPFDKLRVLLEADEPDPAFAPLLALVREQCWVCVGSGEYTDDTLQGQIYPCPPCHGTGYLSRYDYWEAADDGALEGAFFKAITNLPDDVRVVTGDLWSYLWEFDGGLMTQPEDTRQAAVDAVIKWLEAKEVK